MACFEAKNISGRLSERFFTELHRYRDSNFFHYFGTFLRAESFLSVDHSKNSRTWLVLKLITFPGVCQSDFSQNFIVIEISIFET
jgi:hypothetical protein